MKIECRRVLTVLWAVLVLGCFGAGIALADYAYYVPYFANSTSKGELIGLALTNTAATKASVSIEIRDQSGVVQDMESWALPAHGQKADVIGQTLEDVKGSFTVYSDQPLTGLCFLFTQQMTAMMDLPLTQNLNDKLVIPHTAEDSQWNMRIAVCNPGKTEVNVTLAFVPADGLKVIGLKTQVLAGGGSALFALAELLPADQPELFKKGGSLHLESSGGGIVAFSTYSDVANGGTFAAGLSAVDPADQKNNFTPSRSQYAAISCSAADFASGAHALVNVDKPRSVQQDLLPTISDIKMAADGPFFYRIARYNADSVTKFSAAAPSVPIWQYSTLDENDTESTCNPQNLIFVPGEGDALATKAYLPRFDSTTMWIVNPQAASETDFKVGSVDLSDYADADGYPEMTKGVVVGGKLFLLVQRLDQSNNFAPGQAYVVVIDTATDQEIDTNDARSADALKGIALPIKNPWTIVYNQSAGKIFVQGVGRYASSWSGTPAEYSGGIVSIDPDDYSVAMVVDDGDDTSHPYGNLSGLAVVSPSRGYFISYAGWGDNALWGFNPSTGEVDAAPLAAFAGGDNIPALGVDVHGMLWVCSSTTSGGGKLTVINTSNDQVDQAQPLNLNPQGIVFGTYAPVLGLY